MARRSEFAGRPELDSETLRRFAHQVVDWIADYLESFEDRPVFQQRSPSEVASAFEEPLPVDGGSPDAVFESFKKNVAGLAAYLQHPGNFAYVPNSATVVGVVSDALTSALNQNVSLWRGGPSGAAVERQVVTWIKEMLGYPSDGGGVLASGGSLANLMGLALAREKAGTGKDLVFYMSPEIHSSIHRALRFLGLRKEAIHTIKTDQQYRLKPEALADAVAWDREEGRTPAAVVASAGTINSGAVDPLDQIADLCEEERVWLHVDGAYGALSAVAPSGAWMRSGLARADSLSLDPHKWLFVPIDTSCLLVRDPEHMRRFFTLVPEYLKVGGAESLGELSNPMEHTIELTRRNRALRIWMTLKVYGVRAIQERIEEHLRLAKELGSWVESSPRFELLAPVMTSVVCFRRVPAESMSIVTLNELNEEIMRRLNTRGGLAMSHCRLREAFSLRACITHLRTKKEHVERLWRVTEEVSAEVEQEMGLTS
jgi:aromatic-L-amino-acid decarboxylase